MFAVPSASREDVGLFMGKTRMVENRLNDTARGLTVSVRIAGAAHALVSNVVGQKFFRFSIDVLLIRTDETHRPRFHGFGPLCRIAQHEHWLAERRRLLLHPP